MCCRNPYSEKNRARTYLIYSKFHQFETLSKSSYSLRHVVFCCTVHIVNTILNIIVYNTVFKENIKFSLVWLGCLVWLGHLAWLEPLARLCYFVWLGLFYELK